jgi:hypothetical protein
MCVCVCVCVCVRVCVCVLSDVAKHTCFQTKTALTLSIKHLPHHLREARSPVMVRV